MIYFDHAATTPCSKEVVEAMQPYFSEKFGNPSSIYRAGREAREVVFGARKKISEILGAANPTEIIFTSGATESNNLAIKGVAFYASQVLKTKPHIIISSIEHHCVLDTAEYLEKNFGFEVTRIGVNKEGIINPADIQKEIKSNTVIVSIMAGNNEVGSVQPISEIGKIVFGEKEKRKVAGSKLPIYFHTDAVQYFQYFETKVDDLGVDLLSLTGHKFYGPKGVGLLYVRRGTKFLAQQQGGAQERNLRAGTENVPYIVGMAEAMIAADNDRTKNEKEIAGLCDYLIEKISKEIPEVDLLGPSPSCHSREGGNLCNRLPHIATFVFRRIEGESILINLDMNDIAASSGSACTSGSLEPSHVTRAMGYSDMDAHGAVRFSFGKLNKKEDVDKLMGILPGVVEKLRAMSPIE